MSEDKQVSSKEHFIQAELRPTLGPDLEKYPPLEPGASKEELRRRVREVMDERYNARPGLAERPVPADAWNASLIRNPDVQWTVLDGEAVLLNVGNGLYYTLNRVGTVIWELLTGERPLDGVVRAICERFDVGEEVARGDLAALVATLHQEDLVLESKP